MSNEVQILSNSLESLMCHHLHILASHKTDSRLSFSQLSICRLKVGHHISRRNCSQKISVRQICCQLLGPSFLCMNSELSARRGEIKNKKRKKNNGERAGGTRRGAAANRSMGDKRAPNKPMMNPAAAPPPCEKPGMTSNKCIIDFTRAASRWNTLCTCEEGGREGGMRH